MNFHTKCEASEAKSANVVQSQELKKGNASKFAHTKNSLGHGIVKELFITVELVCRVHVNPSGL